MDDTLRINGVVAPEASLPFVARNAAPTGDAKLLLDSNNQAGVAELKVLAGGNCELNAQFQFISFNTTNRLANLAIEPNIGGSNDGEVIFGYGFVNLSDRSLKENVRTIPEEELQQTFNSVEPQLFDRIEGGKDQIGFIAQDVQASGTLGEAVQDQEPQRQRAYVPRLPKALSGPVGRRQATPEAGGEAGEAQAAERRLRLMLHHK